MKHKMSKLLSVLLCCVMLLTLLPVTAAAATADDWTPDYSKSKEATNLDENYESRVTLSLPSAEKQLETDVVFVLDKSTSPNLQEEALKMLNDLKAQVETSNAKVKVGVVIFNKGAHVITPLTDLVKGYGEIEEAIKTEIKSGTNTHAGLLAGKKMLDDDTSVDDSRKYLIFVSDGITYMYDEDAKVVPYYWMNDNSPYYSADPNSWQFKYGNNDAPERPERWDTLLRQIGTALDNETIIPILYDDKETLTTENATSAQNKDPATYTTSVDRALYYTYKTYVEAQQKSYHCFAMTAETKAASTYPWGPSFMKYLADGKTVSFDDIQNDILYLVDDGSYVEDYMGYVEGNYNFDFVNEAKALTMTVGGVTLETKKISENFYGFGEKTDNGYPYELTYSPANDGTEHFVWTMNVPVSNLAHVQLTYTVKLMNPKTAADTYGQYDRYGSAHFDGLYTNNSAALYPKTTGSDVAGAADWFLKPTVSYTVATPTPRPSTSKPSTSKPISSPKTFDAGIALYGAMALLSLTGGAWVVNKKRSDK